MKKTYINPEIAVVKIASKSQILAGSTLEVGTTPTDPVNSDAREFDFEEEEFSMEEEEF